MTYREFLQEKASVTAGHSGWVTNISGLLYY